MTQEDAISEAVPEAVADETPAAAPEEKDEATPTLAELVAQLAVARDAAALNAGVLAAARASAEQAFQFTYADEIAAAAEGKKAVATLDAAVRAAAIAEYNVTKVKKPVPGITINVTNVMEYKQEDAIAWAIESKMCLLLDTKSFEKIAKVAAIPFVKRDTEVTATISTDLSSYLPPAPTDAEDVGSPVPEESPHA